MTKQQARSKNVVMERRKNVAKDIAALGAMPSRHDVAAVLDVWAHRCIHCEWQCGDMKELDAHEKGHYRDVVEIQDQQQGD